MAEVEKGCHRSRLMIATQQEDLVRIIHLQSEKSEDDLDAEHATIDIVTHEDYVLMSRVLNSIQHLVHVIELSVNVSDDSAWLLYGDQIRFST